MVERKANIVESVEQAMAAKFVDLKFAREGIACAMIFVRNDHGSHNPDEAMEIADFGEACRLLFGLLDRLA